MRLAMMTVALLLTACSSPNPNVQREDGPDSGEAGPDVGIAPAAGLSLSYQYGFRLPAERVASVQEDHASQCEALKPQRCRIVGMTYEVGRDRTIMASLQFKLAPDAARASGRQAVSTVVQRGGMLVNARIDSKESGAVIDSVDQHVADVTDESDRISGQLEKPGLSAGERKQLQARLLTIAEERRRRRLRGRARCRNWPIRPCSSFTSPAPSIRDCATAQSSVRSRMAGRTSWTVSPSS